MPLEPLIFSYSRKGRKGYSLPRPFHPAPHSIPSESLRTTPPFLPEVNEQDVIRHFVHLSQMNFAVDTGFYPLGSCTMKYNPKLNEIIANLPGIRNLHPLQPVETVQGILQIYSELEKMLCEIFGMDAFTLQPAAGAQGEFTAMLLIRAYFQKKGMKQKNQVIIPDSAHGTNPASARMAGFEVHQIPSDARGLVSLHTLQKAVTERTAAFMLTNPNTLGLFEQDILKIAEILHNVGAQLFYDGANANAILGISRPGDMGFDVIHTNLHKTFSTPHGGGGPGAGPVGVKSHLIPFLPVPRILHDDNGYHLSEDFPDSIGRMKSFFGNTGVLVRAYVYIRELGAEGLKAASQAAVLNANYLLHRLKEAYQVPYPGFCKHEFVLSAEKQKRESGVRGLDIAKRLMDFGFHPPTVYFPLIVKEALMIEPPETESLEQVKKFADALLQIAVEAKETPDVVKNAPHTTEIQRPDEALAARKPDLAFPSPYSQKSGEIGWN